MSTFQTKTVPEKETLTSTIEPTRTGSRSSPRSLPKGANDKADKFFQSAWPVVRLNNFSSRTPGEHSFQTSKSTGTIVAPQSAASPTDEGSPTFRVLDFFTKGAGPPVVTVSTEYLRVESQQVGWSAKVRAKAGFVSLANWDLGFVQNVVNCTIFYLYRRTRKDVVMPSLPIRDSASAAGFWKDVDLEKPATVASLSLASGDKPGGQTSMNDPRTGDPNSLTKAFREILFKTWLVARNRLSGTVIFLKRFAWLFHCNFAVDPSQPVTSRVKDTGSVGTIIRPVEDGEGSPKAVLTGPIANEAATDKITALPELKQRAR